MEITYYTKTDQASCLAHFGIHIPEWHLRINNLSVLKAKTGGWYIRLPTHKCKETDTWDATIEFEPKQQDAFLKAARYALETYAKQKGVQL